MIKRIEHSSFLLLKRKLAIMFAVFCLSFFAAVPQAKAVVCCVDFACVLIDHAATVAYIQIEHGNTTGHFDSEMSSHESWLVDTLFKQNILPAWQNMTDQLSTMMMQQMFAIGAFFDAELQIDAERSMQNLAAQAYKDYHPSHSMCEFGTNVNNIARAEYDSGYVSAFLNKRFVDRQLAHKPMASAFGNDDDKKSRVEAFKKYFCDRRDLSPNPDNVENSGLFICRDLAVQNGNVNKDIDFTRTVMLPRTLNMDVSDPQNLTDESVFEMSNNLYGHNAFKMPANPSSKEALDDVIDIRSIAAKRGVAQNSFNALVGLKSSIGSAPSGAEPLKYLGAILKDLGVPEPEIAAYLGDDGNMSYYSQMELLAKKLYQRPDFYTNLYDKPENVKRQGAAMQAIGLMLDREIYESYLRSEMLVSIILELRLMGLQDEVVGDGG